MPDIVVTVPKTFTHPDLPGKGLYCWIAEGDAAGDPWTGQEWVYTVGGGKPNIAPGERVYIVCEGKLRGYAPLVRLEKIGHRWGLIRAGGAVAITIPEPIIGFMGWRVRWWDRGIEVPFPEWKE